MPDKNMPKQKPGIRSPQTGNRQYRRKPSDYPCPPRRGVLPTTSSDVEMPDVKPPKKQ